MDILLSSIKEINWLISKGMSFIYLRITNEEKGHGVGSGSW